MAIFVFGKNNKYETIERHKIPSKLTVPEE